MYRTLTAAPVPTRVSDPVPDLASHGIWRCSRRNDDLRAVGRVRTKLNDSTRLRP